MNQYTSHSPIEKTFKFNGHRFKYGKILQLLGYTPRYKAQLVGINSQLSLNGKVLLYKSITKPV